jgi:hypothetical protein
MDEMGAFTMGVFAGAGGLTVMALVPGIAGILLGVLVVVAGWVILLVALREKRA